MINGSYEQSEIDVALTGLPEDVQEKFRKAFNFSCNFVAIKSNDEWAKVTGNGKYLWLTIAPKAISIVCTTTKDKFKIGRMPSDKKVYACTDGTILMAAVQYVENDIAYNLPSEQKGNEFVRRIFERLNNQAKPLPTIEQILKDLQIEELPISLTNWQISNEEFEQTLQKFKEIEKNALEDAYAGIVTVLPKNFKSIVQKIGWVRSFDKSDTYEFPTKLNSTELYTDIDSYLNDIVKVLAIAMMHIFKECNIAFSSLENTLYTVATSSTSVPEMLEGIPEITLAVMTPDIKVGDIQHVPAKADMPKPEIILTNVEQEKKINVNQIVQEVEEANEIGQPISEEAIQIPDVPIDEPVHPDIKEYIESNSAGMLGTQIEGVVRLPEVNVEEPIVKHEFTQIEQPKTLADEHKEILDTIFPNTIATDTVFPEPPTANTILGRGAFINPPESVANLGQPAQVVQDYVEQTLTPTPEIDSNINLESQVTTIPNPQNILNNVIVNENTGQVIKTENVLDNIEIPTTLEAKVEIGNLDAIVTDTVDPIAEGFEPIKYSGQDVQLWGITKTEKLDNLEVKTETVMSTPRPETAIPINSTSFSIDPTTHKVSVQTVPIENQDISNKISPEQAAHNANSELKEVNQLADELEAFIDMNAFKGEL